jgi:hypothetical protein
MSGFCPLVCRSDAGFLGFGYGDFGFGFPAKNFLFADPDDVLAAGDVLTLPWNDGSGEIRTII